MKYSKPKFKIGYRLRILKEDIFSEKDTSHSLQMKFVKLRNYLQTNFNIHHQKS